MTVWRSVFMRIPTPYRYIFFKLHDFFYRRFRNPWESKLTGVIVISYPPAIFCDAAILYLTRLAGVATPYESLGRWTYILLLFFSFYAIHYFLLAVGHKAEEIHRYYSRRAASPSLSERISLAAFLVSPIVGHYLQFRALAY